VTTIEAPAPRPASVRAFPEDGWWWYDVWIEAEQRWTGRIRRADAADLLISLGDTSNQATNRLRAARREFREWSARGYRPSPSS
jgi:hypothetical protein